MATETLRPNGTGDSSHGSPTPEDANWKCVDEVVADDLGSYVYALSTYGDDLYTLGPSSIPGGSTINSVTVHFKWGCLDPVEHWCRPLLRLSGTTVNGTLLNSLAATWKISSEVLARPGGGDWSVGDLADLQGGVGFNSSAGKYINITQVYVEIDYTPAPLGWTGKIAGVTNPAKIMGVDVANIAKVKGVASA